MTQPVKIILKKGGLYGYSLKDSLQYRRSILEKYADINWGKVVKRLNVLSIFNKNKHPIISKKFKNDMKYIQKIYKSNNISIKKKSKSHSKHKSRNIASTKRRSDTVKRRSDIVKRRSVVSKKRQSATKRRH